MGHDLDQVIAAAPGALRTLRSQRDALNKQISALETLVAEHNASDLLYDVEKHGTVENVRPVEPKPEDLLFTNIELSTRGKVIEALKAMEEPLKANEICELAGLESVGAVRQMLGTLIDEHKVERISRGVYAIKEGAVLNGAGPDED